MDYRRWSNFFYGRSLQQSEEMTVEEVTDTLEDAEPVGAVLRSSSGSERIEPSEAVEELKDSIEENAVTHYEHYEGPLDSLHYVDTNSSEENGKSLSLKLREIKL